jgi:hypothetical protein
MMTEDQPLFTPPDQTPATEVSEFDLVELAARRRNRIIARGIGAVLVAIVIMCGVIVIAANRDAKVGSCVALHTLDTLQVVDCSSTNAHMKVVGRVSAPTEPSDIEISEDCVPWHTTFGFYQAADHSVLCVVSLGR